MIGCPPFLPGVTSRSMLRIVFAIVLPLAAAAAGAYFVIAFWLENLLNPRLPDAVTIAILAAGIGIVAFTVGAVLLALRARWILAVLCMIVVVAAGMAPRFVYDRHLQQQALQKQADDAEAEMQFQATMLDDSDDIDRRADENDPMNGDEALAFVNFVAQADLSYRGLMDHTPEAYDLLRHAIDVGALDPNARTSDGKTVTLAFYDKSIAPTPRFVRVHDWEVLQILVTSGADLSKPEAADLRAALGKTVVRTDPSGRTLSLE